MKKKFVSMVCVYCGTDDKSVHETKQGQRITSVAYNKTKSAQARNDIYFFKVCPACNTIIDKV